MNSYIKYFNTPREIVYAHLNKSVYIKGETLAFNAYIFDKNDKVLSNLTRNLYCTITDDNGKVIKSKLLLVSEGVSSGSFFVDSLFTSGNYTFKAYTNYMKNFDEQNFYIQNIKVIDPKIEYRISPKVMTPVVDAQFLPEGGHLVANIENTVGVIIKDSLGFGIPNVNCQLFNLNNKEIRVFKTNQFGIGRFDFVPLDQNLYKVRINTEGIVQDFTLPVAEAEGITLSLREINNKVFIRLQTNDKTLPKIKGKTYKLAVHNGKGLNIIHFEFEKDPVIVKSINYDNLFTGTNILTLFTEDFVPILERLFFNYEGINFVETGDIIFKKSKDSTLFIIPFKDIDKNLENHFSISILPEETKSYNHHHNIISYIYLQPYINSFIENAQFYFTDITRIKKLELDNLLITQGWSSYDWNTIFNYPPKNNYIFETGINIKAHINKPKPGKFLLYPTTYNGLEIFEVDENTRAFEKNGLFPFDDESLKFSEILKNNSTKKPELYLQFFPSKIPEWEKHIKILPLKEQLYFDSNSTQNLNGNSWTEYEQLDEVIIKVKKEKERIEKLKNSSWGNVDVFDDAMRNRFMDLATYLSTKGFIVTEYLGSLQIRNRSPRSFNYDPTPIVYIDDRLINSFEELYYYRLDFVDYIMIDESGFGEGIRGAGGVIKIYTDPLISNSSYSSTSQKIEVPLTFAAPTKFYTPKYNSYQSTFFKEYGVIEWLPNMCIDEKDSISFKISNESGNNIKVFIEGIANNGSFISEMKTVNFD